MKIGLFALETGRNVGGLEVYETNLIRALAQADRSNQYTIFCLDPIVPELLKINAPNFDFCVQKTNRFKGVAWDVPREMRRRRIDLFHALFVPPPFTSIPYVFTMHGSEVLARPDFYPLALRLRMQFLFHRALKNARMILCVSNYVRNFLATECKIEPHRLATVYPGCELPAIDPAAARAQVQSRFNLSDPYILSVGRIEPRKNPITLLRAYDQFRRSTPNAPKLVFAGMKTWSAREFDRAIRQLRLADRIVELGHIPHEQLSDLCAAAEFSVFASLWEGFGFPAIEAMACGSPLLTSNTTSLPEVTAGAALLIDPSSVDSIASGLLQLHQNPNLRAHLKQRALQRAAAFTWRQTALQTIHAYENPPPAKHPRQKHNPSPESPPPTSLSPGASRPAK